MIKDVMSIGAPSFSQGLSVGQWGRDDVLVDQAPDGIDNRKRQLIHIQFNRILHEDIGPLLPRVQTACKPLYVNLCNNCISKYTDCHSGSSNLSSELLQ